MKSDFQNETLDSLSVDYLLEQLISKVDSEGIKLNISEFVSNFKKALNLSSNSEIYIELKSLDTNTNINKHLQKVNKEMLHESKKYYLGLVKTTEDIKKSSIFFKVPFLRLIFFSYLFFFRRFIPKISIIKRLTFIQAMRIYSQAEIMGRLHYCGFKIMQFDRLNNNLHYFLVTRENIPNKNKVQEGLLIKLNRIGKSGKKISVYKFRTMHPYSEFIHEYMIKHYGFNEKGKVKNDFRTSGWGMFLRRTWLDEIPQAINVFKGDMKIFGVRPVSESYFQTLDPEFQSIRIEQMPGCIPPYLVFSKDSTKEQVVESEKIYLNKCKSNKTFWIDLKYTTIAIQNILIKGRRSS